MEHVLHILSSEVIADIRSAAWLESELHGELERHRRHQMADICEDGNVEAVWRTLGTGVSEVRQTLRQILADRRHFRHDDTLRTPKEWQFRFVCRISKTLKGYIRDKIHEYLVALVMAERTEVIIPAAAAVWRMRAENALAEVAEVATTSGIVRRPLTPF